jgi:hypothetical protein
MRITKAMNEAALGHLDSAIRHLAAQEEALPIGARDVPLAEAIDILWDRYGTVSNQVWPAAPENKVRPMGKEAPKASTLEGQ